MPVLVLPHHTCPPTLLRRCSVRASLRLHVGELKVLSSGYRTPTPGPVAQGNIRMLSPNQLLCRQCLQASYPPEHCVSDMLSMNAKQALLFRNSEMVSLRKQYLWVVIALKIKSSFPGEAVGLRKWSIFNRIIYKT